MKSCHIRFITDKFTNILNFSTLSSCLDRVSNFSSNKIKNQFKLLYCRRSEASYRKLIVSFIFCQCHANWLHVYLSFHIYCSIDENIYFLAARKFRGSLPLCYPLSLWFISITMNTFLRTVPS